MTRSALTVVATTALAGACLSVIAVVVASLAWNATPALPSTPLVAVGDADPTATLPLASNPDTPYDGPLVAPTAFREVGLAEIRAHLLAQPWAETAPENVEIKIAQEPIVIDCMAEAGFLYDPTRIDQPDALQGLTTEQEMAFRVAYWGPRLEGPYDWRLAGCVGRAVHETGQDLVN